MSRRRGRERSEGAYRSTGRETFAFARRSLPLSSVFSFDSGRRSSFLSELEDRRTWNPEGEYRPARGYTASRHRLAIVSGVPRAEVRPAARPRPFFGVPSGVGFENPVRVMVCVRRKQRREVIHAKGVAGKKGLSPPRFSFYSTVSCKR